MSLSPTIAVNRHRIWHCREWWVLSICWLLHSHPDFLPLDEVQWGLSKPRKLKERCAKTEAEMKI